MGGTVGLEWPGSFLCTCRGKYFDLFYADLVQYYISTYTWTPIRTENDAHIPPFPTSEQKHFKQSSSHYWITSHRKCRMCVSMWCEYTLIFQLAGENCCQRNHKASTAATNQPWRNRLFFFLPKVWWSLWCGTEFNRSRKKCSWERWRNKERSTNEVNNLQWLVFCFSPQAKIYLLVRNY